VVPFAATGQLGAVAMDCDRVVFHGDAPQLPYGAPIVAYTQRHSGQQVLPAQVSWVLQYARDKPQRDRVISTSFDDLTSTKNASDWCQSDLVSY